MASGLEDGKEEKEGVSLEKRIYIAGPLFTRSEKDFNLQVSSFLDSLGFRTFLPQRDGLVLADCIAGGEPKASAMRRIFQRDLDEIRVSDIFLIILDGRVPDEGACVELGIAYSLNKECIGLKTDSRCLMDNIDNPLIAGTLKGRVARSIQELQGVLRVD